jgi:hypothetical protein
LKQEASQIKAVNVISAYEDSRKNLTGDELVKTIGELMAQDCKDVD